MCFRGPNADLWSMTARSRRSRAVHVFVVAHHVLVTAGFVRDDWKFEVSQFTGREPDQNRFDFDKLRFDSTSVRISWNPDENGQFRRPGVISIAPSSFSPRSMRSDLQPVQCTWRAGMPNHLFLRCSRGD